MAMPIAVQALFALKASAGAVQSASAVQIAAPQRAFMKKVSMVTRMNSLHSFT